MKIKVVVRRGRPPLAKIARSAHGGEGAQGRSPESPEATQITDGTLRDSRYAVHDPVGASPGGGESRRVDGSRGSEVHASTKVGGFQPAPAVASDQRFGEGQAGGTREKTFK